MLEQPQEDKPPPSSSAADVPSTAADPATAPPSARVDAQPVRVGHVPTDASSSSSPSPSPDPVLTPDHVLNGALDDHDPTNIDFLASAIGPDPTAPDLNGMDAVMDPAVGGASQMDMVDMNGAAPDPAGWSEGDNHELKRVKVYELVGSRWVDQGTAFCSGHYDDTTHEAALIARSEADYKNIILMTTIRPQDVYQRQQDTLIVWTEPNGIDYALSFQDPEGCAEVWSFIMDVQPHIRGEGPEASSPLVLGSEPSLTTASIIRSGHLPRPTMGIILEIEKAIKALSRTAALKERVCEYIQQEEYIKQMIETMTTAEDLESLEDLHALCSLTHTILTLNDHNLFDHVLDDDIFFGVVGMLEYDPEFPTYKANYREFLQQTSRFHQPIPIADEQINRKVHATYRLQFLKDVVLARSIDDSTFNVLSSCIMFNQVDIITYVQNDPSFLDAVIAAFCEGGNREKGPLRLHIAGPGPKPSPAAGGAAPATNGAAAAHEGEGAAEDARRGALVLLVQQLCAMGKNVQLPARLALFRMLVARGALHVVQWALARPERAPGGLRLVGAGGEVLAALLDHALDGCRAHVTAQVEAWRRAVEAGRADPAEHAETLLLVMSVIMARSRDLGVQSLVGDALKVLLEVPIPGTEIALLNPTKPNPDTVLFFQSFFGNPALPAAASTSAGAGPPKAELKGVINVLFKPLEDIPDFETYTQPVLHLSREKANLYLYLCDLLCNLVVQHIFDTHRFVHDRKLVTRVATLLRSRDKHLRFAALRFFRTLVRQPDKYYRKHLVATKVFGPILDLTIREMRRDNLISGSCLELFEHIRRENNKQYIEPIMTQFGDKVQKLADNSTAGVQFSHFINRWKANNEELPPPTQTVQPENVPDTRSWGQGRAMEAEEEDYFLHDDDEDEVSQPIVRLVSAPFAAAGSLKRKRASRPGISAGSTGGRPAPSAAAAALASLGDYADDDEDLATDDGASVSGSTDGGASPPPDSDVESVAESPAPGPPRASAPRHADGTAEPDAALRVRSPKAPRLSVLGGDPDEGAGPARPGPPAKPTLGSGAGLAPAAVVLSPGRPGEKRRRGAEDGDEEMLERLATKSKRVSADKAAKAAAAAAAAAGAKGKDDGAKRLKLKFGAAGLAVASAGVTPSTATHPGVKDGDTG